MSPTHAQLDPQARQDLARTVVEAKIRKDLTWEQLADGTGLSTVFVTAALLGQHALPADAARTVAARLDLDEAAERLLRTIRCAAASRRASPPTRPSTASTRCSRSTARPSRP